MAGPFGTSSKSSQVGETTLQVGFGASEKVTGSTGLEAGLRGTGSGNASSCARLLIHLVAASYKVVRGISTPSLSLNSSAICAQLAPAFLRATASGRSDRSRDW